jgi:hypothetical protein
LGLVHRALIGAGNQNPPVKPFRSWPRLIAYGDRVGEHKGFAVDGEVYVAQHIEIEVVVAMMMSASRTLPDFSWMPVCVNISISSVTTRCLAGADLL